MSESTGKSAEQWTREQRVIGRCGAHALSLAGSENDDEFTIEVAGSYDKYERLALDHYYRFSGVVDEFASEDNAWFRSKHPKGEFSAVKHGFLVVGRILRHSVQAYNEFCQDQVNEPSLESFGQTLRHPATIRSLIHNLAGLSNEENQRLEEYLSLIQAAYRISTITRGSTPFEVVRLNDGQTFVRPKVQLSLAAYAEMPNSGYLDDGQMRTCPATNVFLPKLWGTMVDECLSNPQMFADDLGIAKPQVMQVD